MTNEKYYAKLIETSLDIGERRTSKIQEHQTLLELYGLTGLRTKHFLNALLSNGKLNYLEMGVYRGASLTCAMYKNPEITVYAVDDWRYSPIDTPAVRFEVDKEGKPTTKPIPFPNVKLAAQDNIKKFTNNKVTWIEKSFTSLTKEDVPDTIDIVHLQAMPGATKVELVSYLTTIYPLLADISILIMEYGILEQVQEAVNSWAALKKITINSLYRKQSDSISNGQHWLGGLNCYVLTKEPTK